MSQPVEVSMVVVETVCSNSTLSPKEKAKQDKKAALEKEKQDKKAALEKEKQDKKAALEKEKQDKKAALEKEKQDKKAALEKEKQDKKAALEKEKQDKKTNKPTQESLSPRPKESKKPDTSKDKAKKNVKEEEEEIEEVYVKRFEHGGVKYLRSHFGTIYDEESEKEIGMWNEEKRCIEFNMQEETYEE